MKQTLAPRKIWAYEKDIPIPWNLSLGMPGLFGQAKDQQMQREYSLKYKIICYPQSQTPGFEFAWEGDTKVVEYIRADIIKEIENDLNEANEEISKLKEELDRAWK
tara:strand:+ start:1537 stop:1854 length:318 start_codon:yes stop_codon:yes gene_type:complete